MALPPELEAKFPALAEGGYEQTSKQDPTYNCIGHAVGEDDTWWEPVASMYWPRRVPRNYSLAALQAAVATVGYASCATEDLERDIEKIALFANDAGEYKHVARQLPDGAWTSKLGGQEDIRHQLRQLEGVEFGRVVAFMSRAREPALSSSLVPR